MQLLPNLGDHAGLLSGLVVWQALSRNAGKAAEAGAAAAEVAEDDPIEGSPAPPQQQRQPEEAPQGTSSPPSQNWARQRKQLKPLYAGKELDEGAWASVATLLMRPVLLAGSLVTVVTQQAQSRECCCMAVLR